jgi:putative phosphoribosyl transferase
MYFKNRAEAGRKLATEIVPKYKQRNCTVMALSNGGVMVGIEIARRLHCGVTMLLTEALTLPREIDPLATIDQEGGFTFNHMFSVGQLEEMASEYRNYIEQLKLEKLHEMNRLLGADGIMRKELLRHHSVILVSDGLVSGVSLDAAAEFLKPIAMNRLVVATPLASVSAIDRMHLLGDDLYCLSVPANYIATNHYYDNNDIPGSEELRRLMRDISLSWKRD